MNQIKMREKKESKMKDNNCKENHQRGLEKRIEYYNTMHTVRTMPNNPAKVQLKKKQDFYTNVLKMLKLA